MENKEMTTIFEEATKETSNKSRSRRKEDYKVKECKVMRYNKNTKTLDAEYQYRDFKELIVELGYFTKEELTDETPRLLQWIIPEIGSAGFPIRALDKIENENGTLIHSEGDYKANEKNTLKDQDYSEKTKKKKTPPSVFARRFFFL